jgi:hypothetical protein
MLGSNGGLLGKPRQSGPYQAPGVWTPTEQAIGQGQVSRWPIGASDPYWSSVTLLLHFDGTNGSTTFTDSSTSATAFTVNDGTVTIGTGDSVFGGASGNFTTGGDLRTGTSIAGLNFGTGDFTIELWAKQTASTGTLDTLLCANSEATFMIRPSTSNAQISIGSLTNLLIGTSFTLTASTWHHIAVTRKSSVCRAFKDGAIIGAAFSSDAINLSRLIIGDSSTTGR